MRNVRGAFYTMIFKDYYYDFDRNDKLVWEGYVYMFGIDSAEIIPFLEDDFFKIGKRKFIIRNGFYIIEKKKFEKKFPKVKRFEIAIYDKNNEDKFK